MNKKAQFDVARKTIYWMIAGFVITLIVLGFVLVLGNFKGRVASVPPELNAEFISLRFTNIPECFAYQDHETNKVYPGIIDLTKFTDERMEEYCYKTDENNGHNDFNFGLELVQTKKKIKTNNYYQAPQFTLKRKVLVNDGKKVYEDELLIDTQIKVSSYVRYKNQ